MRHDKYIFALSLNSIVLLWIILFLCCLFQIKIIGSIATIVLSIAGTMLFVACLGKSITTINNLGAYSIPGVACSSVLVFIVGTIGSISSRFAFLSVEGILFILWAFTMLFRRKNKIIFKINYPLWFYFLGISVSLLLFFTIVDWPVYQSFGHVFDEIAIKQGTLIRAITQYGLPAINPYLITLGNTEPVHLTYYYAYLAYCSVLQEAGAITPLEAYALSNILIFWGFLFLLFDYGTASGLRKPFLIITILITVFGYGLSILGNLINILLYSHGDPVDLSKILIGQGWSPITGLHISPPFQAVINAPQHILPALLIVWLLWMVGIGIQNQYWKIHACLFCMCLLPTLSPFVSLCGLPVSSIALIVCVHAYYIELNKKIVVSKLLTIMAWALIYLTIAIPGIMVYIHGKSQGGSLHFGIAAFGPQWFDFVPVLGKVINFVFFLLLPLSPAAWFVFNKPSECLKNSGQWTLLLCIAVGIAIHLTVHSNHPYNDAGFRSIYPSIISLQIWAGLRFQEKFSLRLERSKFLLWTAIIMVTITTLPALSYTTFRLISKVFGPKVISFNATLTVEPHLLLMYKWAELNIPTRETIQSNPDELLSSQFYYSGHRALFLELLHSRLFYTDRIADLNTFFLNSVSKVENYDLVAAIFKDAGIDNIITNSTPQVQNNSQSSNLFFNSHKILNSKSFQLLHTSGSYSLFRVLPAELRFYPWFFVLKNENGLENMGNESFFWMNTEPTIILIGALKAGKYTFQGESIPGPSIVSTDKREIVISVNSKIVKTVELIKQKFEISAHLSKGINMLELKSSKHPEVKSLPNGDKRFLIIGIKGFHIL